MPQNTEAEREKEIAKAREKGTQAEKREEEQTAIALERGAGGVEREGEKVAELGENEFSLQTSDQSLDERTQILNRMKRVDRKRQNPKG